MERKCSTGPEKWFELKGDFRVVEVRVIESTSNFTFSMTFIKESYRNIKYTLFKSLKLVFFYRID